TKVYDDTKRSTREYSDTQRLLIYLGLTFVITFLWFFIANPDGSTWEGMGNMRQSFVALGMLFPVIGHVLTRVITKEGFRFSGENNSYFGIVLKDGKWKYFLFACLVPWLYMELSNLIELAMCPAMYDPEYYVSIDVEKRMLMLMPVYAIVTGFVGSFAAFGEEGGWRGYMMPKLLKITGRKRALLIGGVIWGLWHAPLTCIGHNFGTDYPGFPYLGIICMCVFCTLMGVLLTFITEKSGSAWPAAIMHAVNNSNPSILAGFINPDNKTTDLPTGMIAMCIALLVVAVPVMIIWSRDEKRAALEPARQKA
ncbi:MAG: CPBP family intramembrane metalloprotease, partial [Lachnospiraceae bacterium]|nr:CPBP family intramembrane metalloprotease [Lachnospiraceae bacterium]